jgi:hypothetical protein
LFCAGKEFDQVSATYGSFLLMRKTRANGMTRTLAGGVHQL